ncbi:hypothetical protein SAMN04487910_2362 [Aquimarina amphilecti]|uniref:Uncharacterized protein n=1 Tax=Aquimarina amphilecti TaxID=1038014 RepID=A0A1H7Q093_AQUAM|nr:hypothetical protein [Aquimarina amphilecti]SEL40707.1 hypothetical protein SAMN04487910_2362 [Aquimarina amphilecti]
MIHKILNLNGVTILKKERQKSIHGGTYGCQNIARRCIDDSDCCSGSCGVEKIINGNIITLSICSFT